MTDPDQVWSAFSRDPRLPEHADLRASDADRDIAVPVARRLGELVGPLGGQAVESWRKDQREEDE